MNCLMNNITGCFKNKIFTEGADIYIKIWKSYYVINLNSEDQRLHWHIAHTTESRSKSRGLQQCQHECGSAAKPVQSHLQCSSQHDSVVYPAFLFPSSHNGDNPHPTGNLEKEQVEVKRAHLLIYIVYSLSNHYKHVLKYLAPM